jgi:hypothetical protein
MKIILFHYSIKALLNHLPNSINLKNNNNLVVIQM